MFRPVFSPWMRGTCHYGIVFFLALCYPFSKEKFCELVSERK